MRAMLSRLTPHLLALGVAGCASEGTARSPSKAPPERRLGLLYA